MKRREFLKTTAATAAATGLLGHNRAEAEVSSVKNYRSLGKTGLKMSDISIGTGSLNSASMLLRAQAKGINYIDTAPDYGDSEDLIGQVMNRLKREKLILATKFCDPYGYPAHLGPDAKKADFIRSIDRSLKRMKTDYIDLAFVHAMGEMSRSFERESKRLMSPEMFEAAEKLKKAGKIRFLAVSSHGPNNMETLMEQAVDSNMYDVILTAFNFMKFPNLPKVLKKAHRKGVGVVAMKTLAGARRIGLDTEGQDFAVAALKWVLGHQEVSGLVITMRNLSEMDNYLSASGQNFTQTDQALLNRYAAKYGTEVCRTGCNDCESSCKTGVEIATILRYQMYFRDYGQQKTAMKKYAQLEKDGGACLECEDDSCAGACPYGIDLKKQLTLAHQNLSFQD